mgnify:CR=1 FL=1|jgi:hypothetical protein
MNKYQGKVRRRRQNLLIVEGKHEKKSSKDERQGFIWVLNTCVFYIADYNFGLVS